MRPEASTVHVLRELSCPLPKCGNMSPRRRPIAVGSGILVSGATVSGVCALLRASGSRTETMALKRSVEDIDVGMMQAGFRV